MTGTFSIGSVARTTGIKIPTIRYYEAIGLLTAPPRTSSNRRVYTAEHVRRLSFIRHARAMGFELNAIRTLIVLQEQPTQSCAAAQAIARARLADVKQRMAALSALETRLQRMIGCENRQAGECRVIEALGSAA